jgi:hypothetical protein
LEFAHEIRPGCLGGSIFVLLGAWVLSISKQLENWLKPLGLEEKQGFSNRSVVGGLDRFLMKKCDELLGLLPPGQKEFLAFLKQLRGSFSQYMTCTVEERKHLVETSREQLRKWIKDLPEVAGKISGGKLSLSDILTPFIPKEKLRALHLTSLKTVEDLLHYSPKWAVHQSLFTPLAQCANREEPYFIKARINGISQSRRGHLETIKVNLEDGTGHLSWVWFNRPYLKKELLNGRWVILHETPHVSKWGKQVTGKAETYEFLEPEEEKELQAGKALVFYPSTPTLTQAFWRKTINQVLDEYLAILPQTKDPTSRFGKIGLAEALLGIHRPASLENFETARKRLAYDELLTLQTFLIMKRKQIERR